MRLRSWDATMRSYRRPCSGNELRNLPGQKHRSIEPRGAHMVVTAREVRVAMGQRLAGFGEEGLWVATWGVGMGGWTGLPKWAMSCHRLLTGRGSQSGPTCARLRAAVAIRAGWEILTSSDAESPRLVWEQLGVGKIWFCSAGLGIGTGSGDAAPGLGPLGACQANGNSTVFRGLAVAANVGAVSTATSAAAASSIALGPPMEDPLGADPWMND